MRTFRHEEDVRRREETFLLVVMKREIVEFVIKCLECQKMKYDYHHLVGLP